MLPEQDLESHVDFTGLSSFDGSTMNDAFSTLTPSQTDIDNGIGFVLSTKDTALNVPNVPDLTGQDVKRWRRYIWNRRPFDTAEDQTVIIYSWNDTLVSDPVFFKWITTRADITTINAEITNLNEQVAVVTDLANTANTNSSNALTVANASSITAGNAAALANTAQTAATNAQTAANTANTAATNATATANNAATVANAAATLAAGNKPVNQLVPGTAGQRARTNASGTAFELYSESNCYVMLTEDHGNTGDADTVNSGSFQDRTLNTNVQDLGLLITSLVANVFTPVRGTYRLRALIPIAATAAGQKIVSRLYNATDAVQVLQGSNNQVTNATGIANSIIWSEVSGIFTTDGTKGYKIQSYVAGTAKGGFALSLGFTERYTVCELTLIN